MKCFTATVLNVCMLLALTFLCPAFSASAVEPDVDYLRDIKPIFTSHCYGCHGARKQESGLRLDTGAMIRKGGDSGQSVVVGRSDASLLVQRISEADESTRMPPEGKPLSNQQIQLIKAWVNSGARSPVDETPEEDPREHWAFQRPVRPTVVFPWISLDFHRLATSCTLSSTTTRLAPTKKLSNVCWQAHTMANGGEGTGWMYGAIAIGTARAPMTCGIVWSTFGAGATGSSSL